jgi:hypothetical protein
MTELWKTEEKRPEELLSAPQIPIFFSDLPAQWWKTSRSLAQRTVRYLKKKNYLFMDPNAEGGSGAENWGDKNGVLQKDQRLQKDGL